MAFDKPMKKYHLVEDIAMPKFAPRIGTNRYPWKKMRVGSSFSIRASDVSRVRAAASWRGKRYGEKYAVRVDRATGSHRCWRVE